MSNGIVTMTVIGGRVATSADPKEGSKRMTYHPAFINNKGKEISARLTIPILVNTRNQEQPNNMLITAWGKMADVCAKALSPGREINLTVEPKQYQTQYKQKGQVVLINNQPLNITGYSYSLKEISFGAESASFIASEVARGIRGINWYTPNHADSISLNERRKQINAIEFVAGASSFGYATVNGGTQTAPAVQTPAIQTPGAVTSPMISPEMLAAALAHMQATQQVAPATVAPIAQVAPTPAAAIIF